ncbi:MAG: hypothetical protein ACOC9O_03420 [Myxococcota bacterium]
MRRPPSPCRWLGLLLCAGAVGGCSFIDDFDQFEVASGGDGGVVDSSLPDLDCVDEVLGEPPVEVALDTTDLGDDYEASCGGAGAPDRAFQFTAPRDDFYRFHTTGSAIETVLSLRDGDCDAEELVCSDVQDGVHRSEILRRLEGGQRVVAILDGRSGDLGEATFRAEPVECPTIQLNDVPLPVEQSTVGRAPYEGVTCVTEEHGARAYRFTAPQDGHYSFLAVATDESFQPSVTLEAGPACGGTSLQCNTGGFGQAEVLRYLAEGEHVTVIVAGRHGDGDFELDVERRGAEACTDGSFTISDAGDVTPDNPVTFTLPSDGAHRMTTSCGGGSGADPGGEIQRFPDVNVLLDVPDPSFPGCPVANFCEVQVAAEFLFTASLSHLDSHGQCAGQELMCDVAEFSADSDLYELFFTLNMPDLDGIPKVLTIDRPLMPFGSSSEEVTVEVLCGAVCT